MAAAPIPLAARLDRVLEGAVGSYRARRRGGNMAGKAELVDRVAELTGYAKTQVAMTYDLLFELMSEALAADDKVTVPNFGTFQVSERPARDGRPVLDRPEPGI